MSDTAAIVASVVDAHGTTDPAAELTASQRREYEKLRRRHGFTSNAALAILRGREQARRAAEAEPVADAVVRAISGQPERPALPEADRIVQDVHRY